MIEPSGNKVSLPPNRQSKVPGLGMDQRTTKQSIMPGCSNSQAQDDAGYGSLGLGGITDNQPGHTVRLSSCAKAAQDSGSNAAGFQGIAGELNKGAGAGGSFNWHPAQDSSMNGQKSVDGNRTPDGRTITGDNKDIGTSNGMLFPGIIE